MNAPAAGVVVLGDPARLHGRLTGYRAAAADSATDFDSATDTWTVRTPDGAVLSARVLIDARPSADDLIAAHGSPNLFRIPGPHTGRQARYVARLVRGLQRSGAGRIEAHGRVRVHPVLPTRGLTRFYLAGTVPVDDEIYDGEAVLELRGEQHPTRVRLVGHFDPIDGHYHWQGTLYADLPGDGITGSPVQLRVGAHTAAGRISERTPWGTLSVVGAAGYPPFPLEDVDIAVPSAG